MDEDVSIAVEWNGGTVKGFRSKEDAERFISHICKKRAPDFKYSIYSIYNSSIVHCGRLGSGLVVKRV